MQLTYKTVLWLLAVAATIAAANIMCDCMYRAGWDACRDSLVELNRKALPDCRDPGIPRLGTEPERYPTAAEKVTIVRTSAKE